MKLLGLHSCFIFKTASLALLAVLALFGCARSYNVTGDFNPGDPMRIAVLPFSQIVDGSEIGEEFAQELAIDSVPLLSSRPLASPPAFVEERVRVALKQAGLEVVNPSFVRLQLGHHGFVRDRKIAVKVLADATPAKLGDLLLADALLYGVVTEWSRAYYGVESVNTVGIELRLVRAVDGALLWRAESREAIGRGLSGIPTGFSSLVLEPLRGLDEKGIEELASKVVEKSFAPLISKWRGDPENESSPVLLGAVAFSRASAGTPVMPGVEGARRLSVLALGSAGMQVKACLLGSGFCTALLEGEQGHYTTEVELPARLVPSRSELGGKGLQVQVRITDRVGRMSSRILPVDDSRVG